MPQRTTLSQSDLCPLLFAQFDSAPKPETLRTDNNTQDIWMDSTVMQVVLGRWSLQDDVVVGLRSSKWPNCQTATTADSIGCLSNLLPIRAALNRSRSFHQLVNSAGKELQDSQRHAVFPSCQMLQDSMPVCQAAISLAPLASQCCSDFTAKEVPCPVSAARPSERSMAS